MSLYVYMSRMCVWVCMCATLADKQINVIIVCQWRPAVTAGAGYITSDKSSLSDKQSIRIQVQLQQHIWIEYKYSTLNCM